MTIPQDKLGHFLAGIAIAAVLAPLGSGPALAGTTAVAVGKEWWDSRGHGTPEALDALATILGGLALLGWYALMGWLEQMGWLGPLREAFATIPWRLVILGICGTYWLRALYRLATGGSKGRTDA